MDFNITDFKKFLCDLMLRSGMSKNSAEKCLDDESLERFQVALTHVSYDEDVDKNYERLEIIGDGVVNSVVTQYMTKIRFPEVKNKAFIDKLKQKYIKEGTLARYAYEAGYYRFFRYGEELEKQFSGKTWEQLYDRGNGNYDFIKFLEDTFESVVGALIEVVDRKLSFTTSLIIRDGKTRKVEYQMLGPGYGVASKLIMSFMNKEVISLQYDKLWDPVTRLKEMYDQQVKERGWLRFNTMVTSESYYKKDSSGELTDESIYVYKIYAFLGKTGYSQQIRRQLRGFTAVLKSGPGNKAQKNRAVIEIKRMGFQEGVKPDTVKIYPPPNDGTTLYVLKKRGKVKQGNKFVWPAWPEVGLSPQDRKKWPEGVMTYRDTQLVTLIGEGRASGGKKPEKKAKLEASQKAIELLKQRGITEKVKDPYTRSQK